MSVTIPYKLGVSLLSPEPTASGGALVQTNFRNLTDVASGHIYNISNPHNVTTAQIGTYPSGTIYSMVNVKGRPTYVNVRDYGATGDGSTDDTTAILNAVDAAYPTRVNYGAYDWYTPATFGYPTRQGGTVYFPSGVYKVSRSILARSFVNYLGDGQNSVIYGNMSAGYPSGLFHADLNSGGWCNGLSIKNLYLWSNHGHGFSIPSGILSCTLENLMISAKGWAFHTTDTTYCQSCKLEKIDIVYPGSGAIRMAGNLNSLKQINIGGGGTRSGFDGDAIEAMIVLKGQGYHCQEVHIETGAAVKAIKIGGTGPSYPGFNNSKYLFESMWLENSPNSSGVSIEIDTATNIRFANTSYINSTSKVYVNNVADIYLDFANDDNVQFSASDVSSLIHGGSRPSAHGFRGRGQGRVYADVEINYSGQAIKYENMSRYGNMISRETLLLGRGSNVTWTYLNASNIGPTWRAQWTTNPSGYFNILFYGINPANTTDVNTDAWFSAFLDWDVWDSTNGEIISFFGLGSPVGPMGTRWKTKGPILTRLPDCANLTNAMMLYVYGNSGTMYIKDPSFIVGRDFQPPPPPQKYFYSSDGPIWGFDTAAPSTGFWPRGSKIFNTSPASGGVMEWVCVASGIPGTWVARS